MLTIQDSKADFWSAGAHVWVNPVNCVGVMGAGIAGEFKKRYPKMFEHYKSACDRNEVRPGKLHTYFDPETKVTIVNLPTKRHWRKKSELELIELGLVALQEMLAVNGSDRIVAIPAIGCGLGGLEWEAVLKIMEERLKNLAVQILVFPPREEDYKPTPKKKPSIQGALTIARRAIEGCQRCSLHKSRNRVVPSSGNGSSGIALVGEAPGAEEDARGMPFVGRAGMYLRKLILETKGPPAEHLLIVNTLQCRPPDNRVPEPEELQACKAHLWNQLNAVKPRIIVCVGKTAAVLLTQGKRGDAMEHLRGRWVVLNWWGPQHPVVRVIYHPSFLLQHGRAHIGETKADLAEVWARAAQKTEPTP